MKTKIIFEIAAPRLREDLSETVARSHRLSDSWKDRRNLDWHVTQEVVSPRARIHPTRHEVVLAVINAGEVAGERIESIRMSIDIEAESEADALLKARTLLDLPLAAISPDVKMQDEPTSSKIVKVESDNVIGPMPMRWPVGRRITGYSGNLGSYGQGGIGLCGWQLNNGSWMILPLAHAEKWIWLTMERVDANADRTRLDIVVDRSIISAHPSQLNEYQPWRHNYGTADDRDNIPDFAKDRPVIERFEAQADGFVIETGSSNVTWRFQMSERMPGPPLDRSLGTRRLGPKDSIVDSFILAHDCYLDV